MSENDQTQVVDALEYVAMADLAIQQCDVRLQALQMALESYQTRRALYVEKRAVGQLWLDARLLDGCDIIEGVGKHAPYHAQAM